MKRRIIIVGPSGSGKTTLAQAVARELGLACISMDDFRVQRKICVYEMFRGQRIRTFEAPVLWDQNALAHKLRAFVFRDVGFVAEGNHLLYYPQIAAIPEQERYYLDLPHKVGLERRKTRHRYLPADESFALIGESETLKYVWPQQSLPGVVKLDGTASTALNGQAIINRKEISVVTLNV